MCCTHALSHVRAAADFVWPLCGNGDIQLGKEHINVYPGTTNYHFLTDRLYSRTKHCFVHMTLRTASPWDNIQVHKWRTAYSFLAPSSHRLAQDIKLILCFCTCYHSYSCAERHVTVLNHIYRFCAHYVIIVSQCHAHKLSKVVVGYSSTWEE